MNRFGVLVVSFLCLSFSKEVDGQKVPAGDCGYNAYYKCVLNCFHDVFGLTQTDGDFCAGTVQIRGPKKSYSTQDVGSTLKCISGNCRSVVPPTVCSQSPTDLPTSSKNSVFDVPFPTAPPSAAAAPNGASSFAAASSNNFELDDDSEDCEDEDYPASNPLFLQRSDELPLIRKARSSDFSTPSTSPLLESTPDTDTTSATPSTGTTGSTSSPETSTASSFGTSDSTGGSAASAGTSGSTASLTGISGSTSSSVKTSMSDIMDDCDEEDKNLQSMSATDSDECNNDSESSTTENGSSTTSPGSTALSLSSSEVTSTSVYSTTAKSSNISPSSTPLSSSTVLLSSTVLSSTTATPITTPLSSTAAGSSSSTASSGRTVSSSNTTPSSSTGLSKSTLPPPVTNRPELSSRNFDAPVFTDEDCEEDFETNNDEKIASTSAFSSGSDTVVAAAEGELTKTEESNYNSSNYYYDYYDDYYYDNETYSYYDENEDPAENFTKTAETSNVDAKNVIKSDIIPEDRNSQTGSYYTNYGNMPQTSNNLYDENNNFGPNNINNARSVRYQGIGRNLEGLNEHEIQYLLINALHNNGAYQPLPINHNYPNGLNDFPIPGPPPIALNRYQPFPVIPIRQQPAMQNIGVQPSPYSNTARADIFPTNQFGFGWPLNLPQSRGSNFEPSLVGGNSHSIYSLLRNTGPVTRAQYPGYSGNNRFRNIDTYNGNSGQSLGLGFGNQYVYN